MNSIKLISGVFTLALSFASNASLANDTHWHFAVSLDGKAVGFHDFRVVEQSTAQGLRRKVTSMARFNVKVLFVNVYRYEHNSKEQWLDDCLGDIDAHTDDDGVTTTVHGALDGNDFVVAANQTTMRFDHCIMTFAYWNPQILQATHLLNPQTGKYVAVKFQRLDDERITTTNTSQLAQHYALTGNKLKIDLWYSTHMQWLGLQSITADGHTLTYRLQ